jgi:hypothetical protein
MSRMFQSNGQPSPARDFFDQFYCCIDTTLKGGIERRAAP